MSEETHPGEAQTSVGTPDYMEKARELAASYPQLLAKAGTQAADRRIPRLVLYPGRGHLQAVAGSA